MSELESRLREVEAALASHVADCMQYRNSTEASLHRIEANSVEIKQALTDNSKRLEEHLILHRGRKTAWSDARVVISFGFGVAGIVWGIIQTLL